eukprot:490304-Amphidinium_carterae.1
MSTSFPDTTHSCGAVHTAEGQLRVQENAAELQAHILRLPQTTRALVSVHWRKVIEEVHLYLQLYLRVIRTFLEAAPPRKGCDRAMPISSGLELFVSLVSETAVCASQITQTVAKRDFPRVPQHRNAVCSWHRAVFRLKHRVISVFMKRQIAAEFEHARIPTETHIRERERERKRTGD